MGILRADRVSGLGGANAINGSVFFYDHSWMNVEPHDDLTLGSGDFTIECWVNVESLVTYASIFSYRPKSANGVYLDVHYNSGWSLYVNSSYVISGGGASGTSTLNTWAHLALCKSSGSTKLFVDGAQVGSTYSDSNTYLAATEGIALGALGYNRNGNEPLAGHISNLRIIKGEALYTSAFTVPAQRLTKTANTVLLCCQSPGDVTKEETGKIITPQQSTTTTSYPKASHFSPDVGEDYGTTFEDNTKFDTLSYMVPPGGTTTESNRGRGIYAAAFMAPTYSAQIDYLSIQSLGNSIKFGDLSVAKIETASCSSSTRALFGGGSVPGPTTGGTKQNTIDYVTIATTSNYIDFGDLTDTVRTHAGCSNGTRGIFGGGIDDPARLNTIDYVTIASAGNAADFGDLTVQRRNISSHSSTTRGVFAGGLDPGPAYSDVIDYITIASTGNATDFGNLTAAVYATTSCSNSTRGVIMGGTNPSGSVNTIDYVTIATTGNAADFGDITVARSEGAGIASPTRGLMAGGEDPSNRYNTIDYITFSTTGNAADFGDTIVGSGRGQSGSSDCHGGIS